jgi:hypothetical protein
LDRAKAILNSPGRSRLAQRLLTGDVAVWILIKSGHEQKDRRALDLLRTNLEWASASLRIPDSGVDVNGNAIEVTDFKSYPVRFGLMEVARDDPREELLVSALLASEPDLARYDEPIAFPVFGRGRVLYALVGDGIQEKNIREGCNGCHVTTTFNVTKNGRNFAFQPFSDFLTHDMGTLGDGIGNDGDSVAVTRRMRTAPLWGIRGRNI